MIDSGSVCIIITKVLSKDMLKNTHTAQWTKTTDKKTGRLSPINPPMSSDVWPQPSNTMTGLLTMHFLQL